MNAYVHIKYIRNSVEEWVTCHGQILFMLRMGALTVCTRSNIDISSNLWVSWAFALWSDGKKIATRDVNEYVCTLTISTWIGWFSVRELPQMCYFELIYCHADWRIGSLEYIYSTTYQCNKLCTLASSSPLSFSIYLQFVRSPELFRINWMVCIHKPTNCDCPQTKNENCDE